VAVHLGSLLWPKPLQFSVGPCIGRSRRSSPVDRCLGRGRRSFPVGPLPGRSLSDFPWIPVRTEVRSGLLRKDVLAEASSSLLWRAFPGRSRSRSPGAPLRPKPSRRSRIPAWAEALAVHRSVPRVRPKPWRFTCPETPCRPKPIGLFRPARLSAEAGILPGWLPVKAEALAVRLRSAVPAETDPFLRFWIPVGAEALPVFLWRSREAEASGSAGLLDEACRSLQKLRGKPVASAWRRLRQPPSP
jgi:hypothetical protein